MLSHIVGIVSGGASGLGAATTACLVRHGAKVVVADLPSQKDAFLRLAAAAGAEAAKHPTPPHEPYLSFVETDVTDADQVSRALDNAEEHFGEPINTAINCAGIAVARKTASVKKGTGEINIHPYDEFSRVLRVNVDGTFNVARLAAERMIRRERGEDGLRGCIINTASIAAYDGQIGQVAYATSKGAIASMTLPMARDLSKEGIRVMTIVRVVYLYSFWFVSIKVARETDLTPRFIYSPHLYIDSFLPSFLPTLIYSIQAPGLFQTPLLDGLPEPVKAELGATVPCPSRLGKPEEFGQLVISILTNHMLNGEVIRLDGALRMPPK